jgi:hypothetical protein
MTGFRESTKEWLAEFTFENRIHWLCSRSTAKTKIKAFVKAKKRLIIARQTHKTR